MLDHTNAAAILAKLEEQHGPGVLAALLGAAWREDHDSYEAEYAEADREDGDERTAQERRSDAFAEEAVDWLAGFHQTDEFAAGAGVAD